MMIAVNCGWEFSVRAPPPMIYVLSGNYRALGFAFEMIKPATKTDNATIGG